MSEQNIFSENTNPPAGGDATPPNDQSNQFADLLGSIKNDRGEPKYKDVKTALEALKHSQEYIPSLKEEKERTASELAALKAEVERLKNIEDVVERLSSQQSQEKPPAGLSEDAVANLVNQTLTKREQAALREANIKGVVARMQQALGAEADKAFYSKAAELGMTAEQINNLAAQSPTAVLKLFGLEGTQQPVQSKQVQSSVNTAGLQPHVNSFIGANTKQTNVGATTADLTEEYSNSKKMVEELHAKGMTVYDLTDPKEYRKVFGNR